MTRAARTALVAIVHEAQADWRLHVDHTGYESDTMADAILDRLAHPDSRDALAAWLIEAGVLVPAGTWEGVPDADGMVIGGDMGWFYEGEDRPDDAVPLYRIGADRG